MSRTAPTAQEQHLVEKVLEFKHDPEGFVLFAFPWGEKGTPLANFKGPRRWQLEEFGRIRKQIDANKGRMAIGLPSLPIYLAMSSGRGTGKSAFLAMLDMWFMSCWLGGTNIVTANTEVQLRSRTMAELGKWHTMAINSHWFEKTSTILRPQKWFAELLGRQLKMDTQYYYTDAQSWSEENPDAFAGAHSQIAMMVQFDEASGIADPIWNVTEGFFTDLAELRLWVVISNPRRNTGRFFDCFHKNSDYWNTRYIDSRDVEGVDPSVYERIALQHGEDSDVTRVEVKGQFPRTGSNQFISREMAQDAQMRELVQDQGASLILGVDVARFGDDESVAWFRKGRDARSISPYRWKGLDTMELATQIAKLIDRHAPHVTMIDGGGVGGGVVDRLRQLNYRVVEVQFGASPIDKTRYLNKRAECWGEMREWLATGCIKEHDLLYDDLTAPEYDVDLKNRIKLEAKKDMKKRGLNSPNDGDALALTFAQPVSRADTGRMARPVVIPRGFNPLHRG